jgi:hypothetical protein
MNNIFDTSRFWLTKFFFGYHPVSLLWASWLSLSEKASGLMFHLFLFAALDNAVLLLLS